jgi:hypothetical protein
VTNGAFAALSCTEKFAGMPQQMLDEFADAFSTVSFNNPYVSTGYLCPNTTGFDILNNPMDGGKSVAYYNLELVYCDEAANILGYIDPNCETNHTVTQ